MRCYHCNSPYHKKNNCPKLSEQKRARTTCFECGTMGHYRNECPTYKDKEEKKKADLVKKKDEEWFQLNLPHQVKTITNAEEIKKFLSTDIKYEKFWLYSDKEFCHVQYSHSSQLRAYPSSKEVGFQIIDGTVRCYTNVPVERAIHHLSVDEFITFLASNGNFKGIRYTVYPKLTLEMMVMELKKGNIMKRIDDEYEDKWKYEYEGKCYMRGWNVIEKEDGNRYTVKKYKVIEENIPILHKLYDEFKGNGMNSSQEILYTFPKVEFVYA